MRLLLSILLTLPAFLTGATANAEVVCTHSTANTADMAATPDATGFPTIAFPEGGGEMHVMAAASLTDAYNEIADLAMEQNPNLSITIETAGSQTLVTQIEEGARADVLATANTSTMNRAVESGVISGDPVIFTGNRLVIVTPVRNPARIRSIDDLANDGVRLVLANPDVPAGNYSAIAFCNYVNTEDAPEGFLDGINSNIVSEEPDVRHVLTKMQLGEADAGVVYASDATARALGGVELQVLEFPESVPTRADYPIAAVEGGNAEMANAFISLVLSDEGQEILSRYGFK